jgi:hypothetical protein
VNKKIVFTTGTLFGLFLIGSIMQSRESRADGVYSTPVTVFNTTANPASTLGAEQVARVPYESTVSQVCSPGPSNCQFVFIGPSAGHRLVIQNVSGVILLAPGTTTQPSLLFGVASNAVGNSWGLPAGPIVPYGLGSILQASFNQSVLTYVDPGGSAEVTVFANHTSNSAVTLSGYIQDCSIVPCPALQH